MAKIKILGAAFTIVSEVTMETLEKLQKFAPNELQLLDKDKNPVFAVSTRKVGRPSASTCGITFTEANPNGFAQATLNFPENVKVADRTQYILDEFGNAMTSLNALEANILASAETLATRMAAIEQNITVVD